MLSIIFLSFSFICISVCLLRTPAPRTSTVFSEISLRYLVAINTGIGGILAFMGHAFNPDEIAAKIGWAAGSPFQTEVAVANLSFGITGIISFWIGGTFRVAAATPIGVFALGCGFIHARDMLTHGNLSPFNTGAVLWVSDGIIPLVLLTFAALELKRLQST